MFQDVSECFNILINIFHSGTKQSILCDDLHGSDDLSISLSKRLFLFNFKNVMRCLKCRLIHSNDLGCKNSDNILVDKFLNISSSEYSLIGTIHHHGRTIAAGHYTCNIFYPESAYVCNDSHILPLNHFENSDSVYMLFYMRK